MSIRTIDRLEHPQFIAFLEAGMRPESASTRAADDFPVILGIDNLEGLWGLRDDQGWAAGLSVLVRSFTTSAGTVAVAGIGSVVTRSDRRGEGLSSRLQNTVLEDLQAREVALAVLWSDQPAVYAGRGFAPAGWEYHVDLVAAELVGLVPPEVEVRPFRPDDTAAVAAIYRQHPLRTLRRPADHARLFGMPGTRGLVAESAGETLAYAFCGKGEDFPGYVAEWGGPARLVAATLLAARDAGLASRVLIPAGSEDLLTSLMTAGAGVTVVPCGLWAVLRADLLAAVTGRNPAGDPQVAATWLGAPGPDGTPIPGVFQLAVWGFDSV